MAMMKKEKENGNKSEKDHVLPIQLYRMACSVSVCAWVTNLTGKSGVVGNQLLLFPAFKKPVCIIIHSVALLPASIIRVFRRIRNAKKVEVLWQH